MSIRPTSFIKDSVWKWDIYLSNSAGASVNADSTPTVVVYNGSDPTGESVTVTKPSSTTGIYRCSFDPAGEAEGDIYGFSEFVVIASSVYAPFHWKTRVVVPERGTDYALQPTISGRTLDVSSGGEAGLDWSNIGAASSIVSFSNTTISNLTNSPSSGDFTNTMKASIAAAVPTTSGISSLVNSDFSALHGSGYYSTPANVSDVQTAVLAKLPSGLVGGKMDSYTSSLPTMPSGWVTDSGVSTSAVNKLQSGIATSTSITSISDKLPTGLMNGLMRSYVDTIKNDAINVAATDTDLVTWIQEGIATSAEVDAIGVSISGIPSGVANYTMRESYASSGTEMTMAQAMYMIQQSITNFSISGVVISVKKLDGTEAATFTMNSSTKPTSRVRTS